MTVKFTNNASTTVATGINSSATSLTVTSASAFPSLSGANDYCYLTIAQATGAGIEVVKATALSTNTFTIVRAQDNTTAQAFSASDKVELRMTAALLTDVIDASSIDGVKTNFQYTPTAGQTVFSGADNSSNTLVIQQAGLVNVYMNGVRLVQGTDYSVSAANNAITLNAGATTADIIDIEVYGNFTGQSGSAVAITGGAISGTSVAATTLSASGTATLNTFVSNNSTISGGTINNVAIGGTTQAAGSFSDLTATDLTLSDGTNPTLTITDTTNTTSLVLTAGNLSTTIGTTTNHPLTFDTNNTERLRISSTGNVEVKGGQELRVYRGDNATYGSMKYLTGSGGLQLNDKNGDGISFVQNDGASEYMRIDGASGNVGIGVANPSSYYAKDLVVGAADEGGITIAGGTGDQNYLMFADGTSGSSQYKGYIGYDHPTDMMQMVTHGVLRFYNGASSSEMGRFDGTNFLVGGTTYEGGTTSNASSAYIAATGFISANVTNDFGMQVNRTGTNGALVNLRKNGVDVGSIGTLASEIAIGSNDAYLWTSGNNNAFLPASTVTGGSSDGLLDLGSTGRRFKNVYRSGSTYATSDRTMKQDIRDLTDAERNVAVACKGLLKAFRFIDAVEKDGDDANIHFGVIAQELAEAFEAEGLDANDYQVYKSATTTDEEGNEQTRLNVCYENLLAFIISAI